MQASGDVSNNDADTESGTHSDDDDDEDEHVGALGATRSQSHAPGRLQGTTQTLDMGASPSDANEFAGMLPGILHVEHMQQQAFPSLPPIPPYAVANGQPGSYGGTLRSGPGRRGQPLTNRAESSQAKSNGRGKKPHLQVGLTV